MTDENNYKPLKLDPRMYDYIRTTAITTIPDALVEMITNSVDAYNISNENNPKYNPITIDFSLENSKITVIDQAIGMTDKDMETHILSVGSYTSAYLSRGHFSRGIKDISALGNITFTGIKDDVIYQCRIRTDGYGAILNNGTPITDELRQQYKIIKNGFHVELEITKIDCIEWEHEDFESHFALRDIVNDNRYNIIFNYLDTNTSRKLNYVFPENR